MQQKGIQLQYSTSSIFQVLLDWAVLIVFFVINSELIITEFSSSHDH